MIKELLLISALTFTPMNTEDTTPSEPTTGEVETPTTGETTESEENVKEEIKAWLEKFLEPQQVAMIMTWITYAATIIGLIYKISQLAKQKSLSNENIKNLILSELGDKVDESVKNQLASAITSLTKTAERQNEVLSLLAKVCALSQENTPESRVAILDLISRLGVVDNSDIESAKETINKEVAEKKALEEETNNTVDKIIEEHKEEDNGTSI
jgi:hypothetical protein